MGNQISEEVAAEQIEALKEYYDIDVDDYPANVKGVLVFSFKKMKRAIMAGRLEIDITSGTLEVKQHLNMPPEGIESPLVYKEVSGVAKDGLNDDHGNHKRMYYFLGVLSGEGAKVIRKLKAKDLALAEALGAVFLQA